MRTQNLLELKKEISKINNHQAQIKFVYEQFLIDNRNNFEGKKKSKLSTEIFEANKYANEFSVKVDEIENSLNESKVFIFKSIFVFLYTRFEIFLRNNYNTAKIDLGSEIPELKKFKIPETFFKELEIQLGTELHSTFEYLRLRRNSIVHRNENKIAQGEVSSFINASGKKLNEFWKVRRKFGKIKGIVVKKIDFLNKDLGQFSEDEIVDVFNLYRILSEVIDHEFVGKFDREKWIGFILNNYKEKVKEVPKNIQEFTKQLQWFSKELLNFEITDEEAKDLFGGIV